MTGAGSRGDFTITSRVIPISVLAMGIGAIATVVAQVLLLLIVLCTNLFFFGRLSLDAASPVDHTLGPAVIGIPIVGALVIGLMARFGSERIRGHGIPEAIEAILLRGSRVQPRVALLKPLSAAISIGSGGPFGAEGPIIMTGGAVGSILAQLFHLTAAERKTLLVSGAAAGMSAVFGAPVAATLLAIELLLFEWKPRSAIPVGVAAAMAAVLRPTVIGSGVLFPVPPHTAAIGLVGFAACLLCGIAAGFLSAGLTRAVYAVEDRFARLPVHWMWWPAIGAVGVGIGGYLEPRAFGVGYANIADLLNGRLVGMTLLTFALVKAAIWVLSLGSGTSGGVLAPLLTLGAALGGLEASVLPDEGVGFWPLVSMGAILGGTMRSPMTAVIFALELTHDFDTMVPLLIAVCAAYAVTALTMSRSILTEKIARRGFHVSREYAIDPLEILFVREVMDGSAVVLSGEALRAEALDAVAAASIEQRLFAVVHPKGELSGVVTRADLSAATEGVSIGTLARSPVFARTDDVLREVVNRMAESGRTTLPVVAAGPDPRVVGLVTLVHLLQARVRNLDEERRREGPLDLGRTFR